MKRLLIVFSLVGLYIWASMVVPDACAPDQYEEERCQQQRAFAGVSALDAARGNPTR